MQHQESQISHFGAKGCIAAIHGMEQGIARKVGFGLKAL